MSASPLVAPSDEAGMLRWLNDRVAALEQTATIPVGMVAFCAGAVPNGWLLLDGSTFSANRYGQLAAYLASTTLPDARGRVIVGLGGGSFLAMLGSGGVEAVTLTAAQSGMPAHGHGVTDPGHAHAILSNSGGGAAVSNLSQLIVTTNNFNLATGGATTGLTVNNATAVAASAAHSIVQPYIIMRAIIKF